MKIRQASTYDFESVYDFINGLEYQTMDKQIQRKVFETNLQNPDIVYLLAFEGETALGFMSLHIQNLLHHGGPIGEIQEAFVSEKARSLGVGKALISEMKRIAKERDIPQIEVTSRFAREEAHRFYEREGFTHTHKKLIFKMD